MHVSLLMVMMITVAGEGPERPAPAVRAVQHRSDHTTRAPMVLPA